MTGRMSVLLLLAAFGVSPCLAGDTDGDICDISQSVNDVEDATEYNCGVGDTIKVEVDAMVGNASCTESFEFTVRIRLLNGETEVKKVECKQTVAATQQAAMCCVLQYTPPSGCPEEYQVEVKVLSDENGSTELDSDTTKTFTKQGQSM